MRWGVRRLVVVVIAAFAVFGLHGVAIAAPDGACAEASLHHAHGVEGPEANPAFAGLGASATSDGVAIPLAILIGAFLLLGLRRRWITHPVGLDASAQWPSPSQHGRAPPRRSHLSVWRN
jgi:hypothetical protein